MSLSEQIESIEIKVRQLALKFERLQRDNAALQAENARLHAGLDKQEATIIALKNKLEQAQYALVQQVEEETEHSRKLKQLIDQYILEIDKCIEWLHSN
ncbi:MAG TPA: hypothetical protein PKD70_13905 [Saprospiraceae bacterium]|nr:hypothetical protein [Saprospiraceae bacterium]HMP14967.1 hypothetical protein [Saprospiraceae bacterium]